jgi:colanic acid/amylovoran biosynthesis glycosyltransferase
MKVAMIVNSFPELSEKFLINQVTGLIDAGIDLDVYAAVRPTEGKRHDLASRYGLYDRTIYAGVPRSTKARGIELPGLLLRGLVKDPWSTLRALGTSTYTTAARNLKTLYFAKAFTGQRYDVVHCHFGPNGLIGAYLKDCGITRGLVVTFHGSDIHTYPRRHGEGVYRTLYDRAGAVTVNSSFTKNKVVSNGCPAAKVEILPVGLRMEEYPETDPARRDPCTVLTVGRLVEKKGHRYALEAFAMVKLRFPAAEYLVAGDGPLRQELVALARRLGIDASVKFLGDQSDGEVAALYRRATVFVLASVTAADGDMEGQGLVLQEAQGSGLSVVSTLHNGIPDGVLDGVSGFLVPEKDSPALADRIIGLLGDSGKRNGMGAAGRAFVAAKYDTPVLTERIVEIYERAAKSS